MSSTADELRITARRFGADQQVLDAAAAGVLRAPALRDLLGRAEHRLLSVELVESPRKVVRPTAARNFRATIFDYTHNRTLLAVGPLTDPQAVDVEESGIRPLPGNEEFEAAVEVLRGHSELGRVLARDGSRVYRPVPPLVPEDRPDGRPGRTLAVGLIPPDGERGHEIVGVDMLERSVRRYESGAPPTAVAHNPICGLPAASQATTPKGTAGEVIVTVTQGSTVLWRFHVVRPSASSGTNGSGIELRYVDYRGKRVLYRAHVPILNVKYDADACGPYLDWQHEEGMLQADGTDVGPGFRLAGAPATTILDTGNDTGNFRGVAIYVRGQEVVLVSEMEAGWYRYISEWRLHSNGTIRPRFGFGAVTSSCVCNRHHHHVYWRLDFDIRTAGNNLVREFNDPPLLGGGNWHTKRFESRRGRDPARNRRWRVENADTSEGYEIVPGPEDGAALSSPDWPFPQGDVWLLQYRGTEIDHGTVATGPPYEANLDLWLTGEPIERRDVVLWYGAHFAHDIQSEDPGHHGHVVGPELTPVNW